MWKLIGKRKHSQNRGGGGEERTWEEKTMETLADSVESEAIPYRAMVSKWLWSLEVSLPCLLSG